MLLNKNWKPPKNAWGSHACAREIMHETQRMRHELRKLKAAPAAPTSPGVIANSAVGQISVITEKPRAAKSTSAACQLVQTYRGLSDPREIAEFCKKNRTALVNSDLHELIKCRILSGKPLTGFCLTLLATRTEKQP